MLRQRRSMPIMSTVAALLRRGGPREFAASGTVVEQNLVSRVSEDSGCCRELEPLIAVSCEAQHVRFIRKHSRMNFVFLRFTLCRFITASHRGLQGSEQMTLRFNLRVSHEVAVEVNDVMSDFGIQFH
jgi:hypothetical protein